MRILAAERVLTFDAVTAEYSLQPAGGRAGRVGIVQLGEAGLVAGGELGLLASQVGGPVHRVARHTE